jgi:hypothetical protein
MKPYHLLIWGIFIWVGLPGVVSECLALDEGGCLTCHQYPGLVRHEKDDGFKALHIDEAKYARSAHGKTDCRKCHTLITKVPHTGETAVECTTACHLKEKEKAQVKGFPLNGFHRTEQSFIVGLDEETACRVCHHLYPHSENKLVRALLNMHTGFMLCEVCHLKKEKFTAIIYDWRDTENAVFSGDPFGTYFNPKTKNTHPSEHFISRIAVFTNSNGKKQVTMNSGDTHKAEEFNLKEKKLSPSQKEKELAYFHRDIAKKEISVACDECHSSHSIMNFRELGFDEIKTDHLMTLNIKGLVTKYKTFYFPGMFNH